MADISALGGRRSPTGSALDGYFGAEAAASNSIDRFTEKRASNRAGAAMKARDYSGAAGEFYDAGLLGQGSEVQNYGQAQEDRARSAEAETVKKRGTFLVQLARGLKDVPDADRNAQFERFAPALKTLGADDDLIEQLRQAPKDNASLDMFSGGVEKKLVEFIKASDGSYTAASLETGKPVYQYQAPTADTYEQVDPQKNLTLIPGRSGSGAGGGAGNASGQPRNLRNNNPGNIEDGEFAKSLPGYVGSDGRFAKFDSPEAGTQAQTRLLASYGQRGFNTVSKIINRWAPASDGNDVAAYSRFVAQKVGVSPDQPLDLSNPRVAAAVADAIKQFEGGPQTASNGDGGPRVIMAAQPKPGGSFKDEQALRAQLGQLPQSKDLASVQAHVRTIGAIAQKARDGKPVTAADDLALIFAFMKMLDPGSVVREGEFANAQNTAGIPDRVVNAYNRARSGTRLSDKQRAEFFDTATTAMDSYTTGYADQADRYRGLAETYGFSPDNVAPKVRRPAARGKPAAASGARPPLSSIFGK